MNNMNRIFIAIVAVACLMVSCQENRENPIVFSNKKL